MFLDTSLRYVRFLLIGIPDIYANLPLITATDSDSHSRRNNQRKNRQDNTKRSGHNDERGQTHFRQFDVQRQHACLHEDCLGKSEKRGSLTRTGNYRKL